MENKDKIENSLMHIDLFREIGGEDNNLSKTIELYDLMPKYYYGDSVRIENRFLENIDREIDYKNKQSGKKERIKIIITPSVIENYKGENKAYYPGQREELVEDVLRKLATQRGLDMIGAGVGISFSLYEVEKELKRVGHGYSKKEIKDAIKVCGNTKITIKRDNQDEVGINLFDAYGFSNKGTQCFVKFNSLVAESIKEKTYRLFNYSNYMTLKYSLSRWLYKRISHVFRQAEINNPYPIKMSTIMKDSGMMVYEKNNDNLRRIKRSLDEFKEKDVISHYEETKIYDEQKRNKLHDVNFKLFLSTGFCNDIKRGNTLKKIEMNKLLDEGSLGDLLAILVNKPFSLTQEVANEIGDYCVSLKRSVMEVRNAINAVKENIESKSIKKSIVGQLKAAIKIKWSPNQPQEITEDENLKNIVIGSSKVITIDNDNILWQKMQKTFEKDFNEETYSKWISKLNFIEFSNGKILLATETKFLRDWITREYEGEIRNSLEKVIEDDLNSIKIISLEN